MAFGALFINDAGRVQIDDATPCLSLMSAGSAIASDYPAGFGSPTTRSYTLTVTGRTAPLLAVGVDRPTSGDKGFQIVETRLSGGAWTYTIYVWHSLGTDFSLRYYVFDIPYGSAVVGWGMALRDAAGRIVFNSDYPPARSVSAMIPGRKYAAIHGGGLQYQENVSWDSEEMQNIVQWELFFSPYATYPAAGPMNGFLMGATGSQSPDIPILTAPNLDLGAPLILDVTGYVDGSGDLPVGYDWLVHPTTGEQLTWSGDNLVWAA